MTTRDLDEAAIPAALALNNAHAEELSFKTEDAFRRLLAVAYRKRCTAAGDAFLIAFDQDADYPGECFAWFKARYARFVYVDRVAVDPAHRKRGLARLLYEELFAAARVGGHDRVLCEVNLVPPNPGSDAFHAALGFEEVGRGRLTRLDRDVRYLALAL